MCILFVFCFVFCFVLYLACLVYCCDCILPGAFSIVALSLLQCLQQCFACIVSCFSASRAGWQDELASENSSLEHSNSELRSQLVVLEAAQQTTLTSERARIDQLEKVNADLRAQLAAATADAAGSNAGSKRSRPSETMPPPPPPMRADVADDGADDGADSSVAMLRDMDEGPVRVGLAGEGWGGVGVGGDGFYIRWRGRSGDVEGWGSGIVGEGEVGHVDSPCKQYAPLHHMMCSWFRRSRQEIRAVLPQSSLRRCRSPNSSLCCEVRE